MKPAPRREMVRHPLYRCAALRLLQGKSDLLIGKSRLLHRLRSFHKVSHSRKTLTHTVHEIGKRPLEIEPTETTFHGLRHSHACHLIREGVDLITISQRLFKARRSRCRFTATCFKTATDTPPTPSTGLWERLTGVSVIVEMQTRIRNRSDRLTH